MKGHTMKVKDDTGTVREVKPRSPVWHKLNGRPVGTSTVVAGLRYELVEP